MTGNAAQQQPASWIRLGSGLLAILLWLAGCGSSTPPLPLGEALTYEATATRSDFTLYSDPTYPFEVQLPRDWYIGQLAGTTYSIVASSTNDPGQPGATINIAAFPVTGTINLENELTVAEKTLQSQPGISDFTLELVRPATTNGAASQERLYRYTFNNKLLRQRTVYVLGDEQIYAISLIAPDNIFAQHEAIFTDVLASFKGD